jgi:hypothetical protein
VALEISKRRGGWAYRNEVYREAKRCLRKRQDELATAERRRLFAMDVEAEIQRLSAKHGPETEVS